MSNLQAQRVGMALIAIGVLFVLARSLNFDLGDVGWPFFILVPGLVLLAVALRGPESANLAVPACIVSTVGLILLAQNATGRFETWAYAWALLPAAAGLGQLIQGNVSANEGLRTRGRRDLLRGLGLFAAFALGFELFIFGGLGAVSSSVLIPILLIALGLFLLRPWRRGPQ